MIKTFLIVELGLWLDRFTILHYVATLLLLGIWHFIMMATTSTVKLYISEFIYVEKHFSIKPSKYLVETMGDPHIGLIIS